MPQRIGPNEPCSCGSGKKHKHCCMDPKARPRVKRNTLLVAALFLAGGIAVVLMSVSNRAPERLPERETLVPIQSAPAGRVWSSEHGHWHAPPGDPPEGKVWSPEHGHWHDIQTGVASN